MGNLKRVFSVLWNGVTVGKPKTGSLSLKIPRFYGVEMSKRNLLILRSKKQ
jgi:hypothetical protein